MAEVIIPGPSGRLEGRYQQTSPDNPVALVLHPHPEQGGTMHNKVTYILYQTFLQCGFNVLRFNFRGIGKSEGHFDNGEGELNDAAAALDWLQDKHRNTLDFWVGGFSFGAWIGMQLLMRRPEITGFVSVSPPANMYDFNFLAPCPTSGLFVQGDSDMLVPYHTVKSLADKLSAQKGISVDMARVQGADHFFTKKLTDLNVAVKNYLINSRT